MIDYSDDMSHIPQEHSDIKLTYVHIEKTADKYDWDPIDIGSSLNMDQRVDIVKHTSTPSSMYVANRCIWN